MMLCYEVWHPSKSCDGTMMVKVFWKIFPVAKNMTACHSSWCTGNRRNICTNQWIQSKLFLKWPQKWRNVQTQTAGKVRWSEQINTNSFSQDDGHYFSIMLVPLHNEQRIMSTKFCDNQRCSRYLHHHILQNNCFWPIFLH